MTSPVQKMRAKNSNSNKITGAEKRRFVDLHNEGMIPTKIALECSRSTEAVSRALRAMGITPNYTKRKRTQDAREAKTPPITHESLAVFADGGSLRVSHGLGEDHAEAHLDAMVNGRKVVHRGIFHIGAWRRVREHQR